MAEQVFEQIDTQHPTETRAQPALSPQALMWLVVLASALVRGFLVFRFDFPLNDGGFLYQHVQDLLANNFIPPEGVNYNFADIPFASPPLAPYLVAGLNTYLNVPVLVSLRWLPVILSTLALPAIYLLMSRYFEEPRLAVLGTLAFSATSSTLFNVLAGSGTPAAAGMLFAALALWQGTWLVRNEKSQYILTTAFFTALALLSSIHWGVFTLLSLVVFYFSGYRSVENALQMLGTGLLTLVLVAPWGWAVIRFHGAEPFFSTFFNAWDIATPFAILFEGGANLTLEPTFAVLNMLAVLGLFVALARGRFNLVVWIILVLLLMPDASQTVTALPLAFAIAIALDYLVLTGIASFRRHARESEAPAPDGARRPDYFGRDWAVLVSYVLTVLVIAYPLFPVVYQQLTARDDALLPLTAAEQAAMGWVNANTDSDATFVLVTDAPTWDVDAVAAWFPVLAERRSLNTVQGTELLPDSRLRLEKEDYDQLQACQDRRVTCLDTWAQDTNKLFTHVWFSAGTEGLLSTTVDASPNYNLVYDQDGIQIFAR